VFLIQIKMSIVSRKSPFYKSIYHCRIRGWSDYGGLTISNSWSERYLSFTYPNRNSRTSTDSPKQSQWYVSRLYIATMITASKRVYDFSNFVAPAEMFTSIFSCIQFTWVYCNTLYLAISLFHTITKITASIRVYAFSNLVAPMRRFDRIMSWII